MQRCNATTAWRKKTKHCVRVRYFQEGFLGLSSEAILGSFCGLGRQQKFHRQETSVS